MADVIARTNFEGIILNKIKQPHAKKKKKKDKHSEKLAREVQRQKQKSGCQGMQGRGEKGELFNKYRISVSQDEEF